MENTLNVGDRVLVNRLVYHSRPIERGDVVVFDGTDSFVPASAGPARDPISAVFVNLGQALGVVSPDGSDFVKRVVGVAGDHVQCCDAQGRLLINGKPLDEPYLYPGDVPSAVAFDAVVPEGKLWVMGDNRGNSRDSRYHLEVNSGGVPVDNVVGRAFVVLWPLNRFTTLPIPETFGNPALNNQTTISTQ